MARQAYEMRAMEPEQYQLLARVPNVRGSRLKAAATALDPREVGALLDWLRVRGEEPGALLVPADGKGRLAIRHLTAQAVYNAVAKRRAEAGIRRRFSPHDLRHFFAGEAVAEGGDLKAVSDLLGHASVSTTQIYVHGGERAKRQAAALVGIPYGSGGGRRRRRRKKRRRCRK